MSQLDIVRAWKDQKYRLTLTDLQLASLPPNPAGCIELDYIEGAAGDIPIIFTCIGICAITSDGGCGSSVALPNCSFFGCPTAIPFLCPLNQPERVGL